MCAELSPDAAYIYRPDATVHTGTAHNLGFKPAGPFRDHHCQLKGSVPHSVGPALTTHGHLACMERCFQHQELVFNLQLDRATM